MVVIKFERQLTPAAPACFLICCYAPRIAVKLGSVLCRAEAPKGTGHQAMQPEDACLLTLRQVSYQLGVCNIIVDVSGHNYGHVTKQGDDGRLKCQLGTVSGLRE